MLLTTKNDSSVENALCLEWINMSTLNFIVEETLIMPMTVMLIGVF